METRLDRMSDEELAARLDTMRLRPRSWSKAQREAFLKEASRRLRKRTDAPS